MKPGRDIVVVGSCMIDFVSYAPRLPTAGETIHGTKFATNYGGKGANQCVAAAKLGGKTTLVARVGDDIWGGKYISNLVTNEVNTEFTKTTTGFGSGVAQIIVSDNGSNQIVIVPAANTQLSLDDLRKAESAIKNASVLVCQLETSVEVAIKAMEMCDGITILNGAPAIADFTQKLLETPDIFCVNESEATIFSGHAVTDKDSARCAIKELLGKGCKSVIITLGSEGALYGDQKTPNKYEFVECPKVNCVDSTGAGDAFIGALAYMLANESTEIRQCIKMACIVASDSVTRPGTQISFPGRDILA